MQYLILLFCCINITYSQYIITPRLGEEIDLMEKEYFGLFPRIKNFHSAKAIQTSQNEFDILIQRTPNLKLSDTTIKLSSNQIQNINQIVNGYELIRNRQNDVNWSLLKDIANPTKALENELNSGTTFKIEMCDGKFSTGKLLYVDDSILVLWHSSELYNFSKLYTNTTILEPSKIKSMIIERTGNFVKGAGYGSLAGLLISSGSIIGSGAYNDSWGKLVLVLGSIAGTVVGLTVGTSVGAIMDIDSEENINCNLKNFKSLKSYLLEKSIFSTYPPPELVKLKSLK